jgi:hypothetical protein
MKKVEDAITLTFGDVMENHIGMEKIGTMSKKGYSLIDLLKFKRRFNRLGLATELINLNRFVDEKTDPAYLLIIKNGVSIACEEREIYNEHKKLVPDKKYYDTRRKKVLNKLARWNLCFDDKSQECDYENGKGTIVSYDDVPFTKKLKKAILKITKDKDLKLEANYYYNIEKTFIQKHGDCERKKVVGVRFGSKFPLVFAWYKNSDMISENLRIILDPGDMYIMSEKAVGTDWKKRSIATLRHAAGAEKFIK